MKLLRHEQVNVFVMLLERSKAIGVPAHEKRRAQRIICGGNLPDMRHATVAPFAQDDRFQDLLLGGMVRGTRVREKGGGQFDAAGNGDEEINEQQGQEGTADFQDAARVSPADSFRVVKDRLAFFHVVWPPHSAGGAAPEAQYSVESNPSCLL